jgi:hypothetical protein
LDVENFLGGKVITRWVFKIPGTLDKFLTKFQEVPKKLKKIF